MACAKQQTQSTLNMERATKTMQTLTWVVAVLTLINVAAVAVPLIFKL